MKFSQTTLLAILATTAFASAAPAAPVSETALVTRGDANEVMNILTELKQNNEKRDMSPEEEASVIAKRDSLLVDLVAALDSSGIISDVWNTLTQDTALRTEIVNIVKQTIKASLVEGPALIKAIWHSGLLGKIFKDVLNDGDLRSVLFRVAKSLFSSAVNLLKHYKASKSNSGSTATATAANAGSAATAVASAAAPAQSGSSSGDIPDASQYNSGNYRREFSNGEYLDKRDMAEIVSTVAKQIKDSGLVSGLIKKVMQNPDQSIAFLSKVFHAGLVASEDIFKWAKQSGLLEKGLNYLEKNGGQYSSEIASFLGDQLEGGNVTSSDIDNASSSGAATAITGTADIGSAATAITADIAAATAAQATTMKKVRRAY